MDELDSRLSVGIEQMIGRCCNVRDARAHRPTAALLGVDGRGARLHGESFEGEEMARG